MSANQQNHTINVKSTENLNFAEQIGVAIPASKIKGTDADTSSFKTTASGSALTQNDAYSSSPILSTVNGSLNLSTTEPTLKNLGTSGTTSNNLANNFQGNLNNFLSPTTSGTGSSTTPTTVDNSATSSTKGNETEKADTMSPLSVPNQYNKVKGMLSIPAPGAHVWVMFENGDPNYPIVMGVIYGQADYQGIHDISSEGSETSDKCATTEETTKSETDTTTPETSATNGTSSNKTASGDSVKAADNWKKNVGTKSGGYCWRNVKKMLLAEGVVNNYMDGIPASNAGSELTKNGFTKINVSSPSQAPAGSVLVYSGGQYGHVEMKTSDGGYVSDFYRGPNSTIGRKLIGVYVK